MTEPASTEAEAADSTTIPLFPLGLVLFPGGQLPLKVFEQRYVEMTKSCLRNDSPFGVCLIRHGREVGEPADHETIGCSARITNWEMPHPGLFHLLCSGERVFRVSRTHIEHKSLIVGDVQWLDCKTGEMDSSHFDICRRTLERLIGSAGDGFFVGPARFDDAAWISYRLAELLPLDTQGKQAMLAETDTGRRLATLAGLLPSS